MFVKKCVVSSLALASLLSGCATSSYQPEPMGFLADVAQPRPVVKGESEAMKLLMTKFPQFAGSGLILAADTAVSPVEAGKDQAGFDPEELFKVYSIGISQAEKLSEKYGTQLPVIRAWKNPGDPAKVAGNALNAAVSAHEFSTPTGPLGFIPRGTGFSSFGIGFGAALFVLSGMGESQQVAWFRWLMPNLYNHPGWSYEPDKAMRDRLAQYKSYEELAGGSAWVMVDKLAKALAKKGFESVGETKFGVEVMYHPQFKRNDEITVAYRIIENEAFGCPKASASADFHQLCRVELLADPEGAFVDNKDKPTVYGFMTSFGPIFAEGFSVPDASATLYAKARDVNEWLRKELPAKDRTVRVYLPAEKMADGKWKPQKVRVGKKDLAFEVIAEN